ncbi:hypothetical protein EJ02DRAFT_15629 [Clathrospora elynae]|uniref:Uncharacterized protein n=1 Tax=Clathrospora elynae TaxID=706981 RepID=A0A6A5T1E9_9PLEO|nr:hypothetical protein EJ02DRAFT_15629 [Clathrospora elynae]
MQALRKEVVLLSTRIAKIGNLLHSTVQYEVCRLGAKGIEQRCKQQSPWLRQPT